MSSTSTLSLVSLARAKQNPALANLADDVLTSYLEAASQLFMTMTNRTYWADDYEDEASGDGSKLYITKKYPIIALVEVEIEDEDTYDAANFKVAEDEGFIYGTNGVRFSKGCLNLYVRYTAGYTTIPADIQEAIVQLAGFTYGTPDGLQRVSEQILDYSVSYASPPKAEGALEQRLPPYFFLIVNKYKDIR